MSLDFLTWVAAAFDEFTVHQRTVYLARSFSPYRYVIHGRALNNSAMSASIVLPQPNVSASYSEVPLNGNRAAARHLIGEFAALALAA